MDERASARDRGLVVRHGDPASGPVVPARLDAQIHLYGDSPCLVVEGQPVAWYENWLRERHARRA